MVQDMKNKVALITGGSAGIGRASALAFSREGVKVVIVDIDEVGGDEIVNLIKRSGGEAIFVKCDVTKAAEVEVMVNRSVEAYGSLDYAVNNAGVFRFDFSTADCEEAMWDHIMGINLKGVWLCMKYEIPRMLKQGKGVIVNMSSIAGIVGLVNNPVYVASKHGVIGLTKAAALEYASKGIRVNAVCPGGINKSLHNKRSSSVHPIGRQGTPTEIAESVIWLCSDSSSFVTGHALVVDGGRTAQ